MQEAPLSDLPKRAQAPTGVAQLVCMLSSYLFWMLHVLLATCSRCAETLAKEMLQHDK